LFIRIARTLACGLQNYSQATVESTQGEKKEAFGEQEEQSKGSEAS
jgi:hypothetical protein